MENKISKKIENEMRQENGVCVACCITLGKQPHIGHLMLLSIAEQMRSGLGSELPIVLINNNTGPRSAGTLLKIALDFDLSVANAAMAMNNGLIEVDEIVGAYRGRLDSSERVSEVEKMVAGQALDIFSVVSKETQEVLRLSGYKVEIASGSYLLNASRKLIDEVGGDWKGTGYTPLVDGKRVVLLEKSGDLTSTGVLFAAVNSLSEMTKSGTVVVVDSQPEVSDANFALSVVATKFKCVQVMGAGVGIGGAVASGTGGEAVTIKEARKLFNEVRPGGNLKKAVLYFTLNNQLSFARNSIDLKDSFYNFDSGDEVMSRLVDSWDKLVEFNQKLVGEVENLALRVGSCSLTNTDKSKRFLEYLQSKASGLLAGEAERVLAESKRVVGGVRQNYYFNQLKTIMNCLDGIVMLREDQFLTIGKMLQFCIDRSGI